MQIAKHLTYSVKKLGNASSAVAPLQAGSVAATHTHRSVRAKACHCLAHELGGWGVVWGGVWRVP